MLLRGVYQIGLGLVTIVAAPYFLWQWAFQGKYRGILAIRLGLKVPALAVISNKKCFWVHAVSLGEVKAAKAFIRRLSEKYPDHQIFLSTLTNTGFQEAQKISQLTPRVSPFVLPSDLHTKRLMQQLKPEILFLVEGDIWPNMVHAAAKTIVVNGKISARSTARYQAFPFIRSLLLDPIHLWLVQSQTHQERLVSVGVLSEKIQVTGDLKMAPDIPSGAIYPNPGLLILSTHRGEEELLLKALTSFEGLIFLAPRHPERFIEVASLLEKLRIPYTCHSSPQPLTKGVLLIDAIGVLAPYFRAAPITIIGGSFVSGIGGHNLLEPTFYGSIPVFGPHVEKQTHLKELLEAHNLCYSTSISDLNCVIQQLWSTNKSSEIQCLTQFGKFTLESAMAHIDLYLGRL